MFSARSLLYRRKNSHKNARIILLREEIFSIEMHFLPAPGDKMLREFICLETSSQQFTYVTSSRSSFEVKKLLQTSFDARQVA